MVKVQEEEKSFASRRPKTTNVLREQRAERNWSGSPNGCPVHPPSSLKVFCCDSRTGLVVEEAWVAAPP